MALDNATIYTFLGLAVAILVLMTAGRQQIANALMLIGLITLPFIALGGTIYLAVKHGTRNGRHSD